MKVNASELDERMMRLQAKLRRVEEKRQELNLYAAEAVKEQCIIDAIREGRDIDTSYERDCPLDWADESF